MLRLLIHVCSVPRRWHLWVITEISLTLVLVRLRSVGIRCILLPLGIRIIVLVSGILLTRMLHMFGPLA